MTKTTEPRNLQKAYPPDFTHLIAEVADTAMKAIIEPDPTQYIQKAAVSNASELRRRRRNLAPERRRDRALAATLLCDVIRNGVIRTLATDIVEAYERLRRAKNMVPQTAKSTVDEGSQRKDASDARRGHTSPLLVSG